MCFKKEILKAQEQAYVLKDEPARKKTRLAEQKALVGTQLGKGRVYHLWNRSRRLGRTTKMF